MNKIVLKFLAWDLRKLSDMLQVEFGNFTAKSFSNFHWRQLGLQLLGARITSL